MAPPSDAEVSALLGPFLQARVDGESAEEYLPSPAEAEFPLLYATTSGARTSATSTSWWRARCGPPAGWSSRSGCSPEGGRTVVEQPFILERVGVDGRLELEHGSLTTIQDITEVPDSAPIELGTCFIDPDHDPSHPLRVVYEVPVEGWSMWIGAVKFGVEGHIAVSITTVTNLVRHGCRDHPHADPPVGTSVDDLATALADLALFRVTSPPRDVTVYGYSGDIPGTDRSEPAGRGVRRRPPLHHGPRPCGDRTDPPRMDGRDLSLA